MQVTIPQLKSFLPFLTCLLLLPARPLHSKEPLPQQPKKEIVIRNSNRATIRLQCEVVDRPETRNRGLMFRSELGSNDCMLFVFEQEQPLYFWMKNTTIPLSIAYINSKGKIVSIKDMTPMTTEAVTSDYPAMYALEMNRGWFRQNGVNPGDFVKIMK